MAVDEVAEFAEEYNSQLRAMKRPAKEEINALTMVAADYVDNPPFALAVVQVLERCIQESQNDRKLIPLYVLDSILKNVQPQGAYSALIDKNLTWVMASAFMSVDNACKPKFIKLLKTWDEGKIFPESKILEVRDTMTLMLTNGGVFPAHLSSGLSQGPQLGGHAHMAQGPMDVEAFNAPHNPYAQHHAGVMHAHQQFGGNSTYGSHGNGTYTVDALPRNARPSNSPILGAGESMVDTGPRILSSQDLASRDVSDVILNLYDARPHLCRQDGRRFREKEELQKHIDEIFAKNKNKKERTGIQERLWFWHADEWCKAQDVTSVTENADSAPDAMQVEAVEEEEEEKFVIVGAGWGSGLKCMACHEELKKSWDVDSDEWVFRGVIRLDEQDSGRPSLIHQSCHRASALHT